MTRLTGMVFLCVGFCTPDHTGAQDNSAPPPVLVEFVNFQSTHLKSSGKPVTVGVFRIKNNTDQVIHYGEDGYRPDFRIQRFVDGEWKLCYWNDLCALGKRTRDLLPENSVYFYIDPEYYRAEFGEQLRFGVPVSSGTPTWVWTKTVDLPVVDNPDELPRSRFVVPKQQATER